MPKSELFKSKNNIRSISLREVLGMNQSLAGVGIGRSHIQNRCNNYCVVPNSQDASGVHVHNTENITRLLKEALQLCDDCENEK
mmetsp:Transcript_28797/g.42648  ORF Transcript_28797/g.42648 Transcript_28797/m.42648 type:complete len:84 (+) Transcript_28797:58-309(+)